MSDWIYFAAIQFNAKFQTFGQSYNFIDGGVPAALNHFNISIVKPFTRNGFEVRF